jgi:hypoxanthine phosphoribosyltransferase
MLRDNYKPDCIVGLLRGGIVPARIFSDYFNIMLDFFALDVKLYEGINRRKEKPVIGPFSYDLVKKKDIFIVDDIFDSGKTMEAVLEYFRKEKVTTATLFWKETASKKPNYYAEVAKKDEWIVFPFEKHEFRRETLEREYSNKQRSSL